MDQVILQSQDGREFKVEQQAAQLCVTVRNLIEDAGTDNPIPLPNVSGKTLERVIIYCKHRIENPTTEEPKDGEITGWEADFVKELGKEELFELVLAANYMDVKPLLDLGCQVIANMIKGKTPEEIRKTFDIKNDFTPEEEEQVRKENEWCEER